MKIIPLIIILLGINYTLLAQDSISAKYINTKSTNNINFFIKNNSSEKIFYYSVSLDALVDTGWMHLLSDIDALGQNEFLALLPIKPKQVIFKTVSRKKILFEYSNYSFKKIRFGVMYYERRTLESKGGIIYLPDVLCK